MELIAKVRKDYHASQLGVMKSRREVGLVEQKEITIIVDPT